MQVRVMPKCWFILLRFWLRVDHTLVRLRETRYFCNTSSPTQEACIIRETTHSEGTFEELGAAGAPPEGVCRCFLAPSTAPHKVMFSAGNVLRIVIHVQS